MIGHAWAVIANFNHDTVLVFGGHLYRCVGRGVQRALRMMFSNAEVSSRSSPLHPQWALWVGEAQGIVLAFKFGVCGDLFK